MLYILEIASGGSTGSSTVLALDDMIERASVVCDAIDNKFSGKLITVHGGSIESSTDFGALLKEVPRLDGYIRRFFCREAAY